MLKGNLVEETTRKSLDLDTRTQVTARSDQSPLIPLGFSSLKFSISVIPLTLNITTVHLILERCERESELFKS